MIQVDYTEGEPFWKWFFSQSANIFISVFWVIAIIVICYNEGGLFVTNEGMLGFIFTSIICFFNLGMSYKSYKELQKGISK